MDPQALIGPFLAAAAVGGGGYLALRVLAYRRMGRYRTAAGTVRHSEIRFERRNNVGVNVARVEYEYRVGTRTLTGNVINGGGDMWTSSRDRAEAVADRYRPGDAIDVHYDPAKPTRSHLERSPETLWVLTGATALCATLALIFM